MKLINASGLPNFQVIPLLILLEKKFSTRKRFLNVLRRFYTILKETFKY